jgi:hypothetical protein
MENFKSVEMGDTQMTTLLWWVTYFNVRWLLCSQSSFPVSLSLKLKNGYFPKQLNRLAFLMEQTVLFEVGSELL